MSGDRSATVLYGRDAELAAVRQALQANRIVLLRGPSGIGKSEFAAALCRQINQGNDGVAVLQTIVSSAHSIEHILGELTVQLLSHVGLAKPKLRDIGRNLVVAARDHTWSLASAALLDVAGTFFPGLSKATEAIFDTVKQGIQSGGAAVNAGTSRRGASADLVPGFLNLISAMEAAGSRCTIVVDRAEAASDGTETALVAITTNLPRSWSMMLVVNDELPEGIALVERTWPQLAYVGGRNLVLGPLDEYALEQWTRDRRRESASLSDLQIVVRNCEGRPLLMREWVERSSDDAEYQVVWQRLGPYYAKRLRALSESARTILRTLALLPPQTSFPLSLVRDLLSLSSLGAAYEIADELVRNQFLEPNPQQPDEYRFVHDVTRYQVSRLTPRPVMIEAAAALLEIDAPMSNYTRALLNRVVGRNDAFVAIAVSEAGRLAAMESYRPALELYRMCLGTHGPWLSQKHEVAARFGIASVLLSTGYYEEALTYLPDDLITTPGELGRAALLRGRLFIRLNRYRDARNALARAEESYLQANDEVGLILVGKEQNTVLRDLGRYDEALTQARALVRNAISLGLDSRVTGSCFRALARSAALARATDDGVIAGRRALELALEAGSASDAANARLAIAEALRHGMDLAGAISEYRAASELARSVGNRDSFLWCNLGLADCFVLEGDALSAVEALRPVGDIVAASPARHPLEHLHWRLIEQVIEFLRGFGDPSALREIARSYEMLGVSWPTVYVEEVVTQARVVRPMTM